MAPFLQSGALTRRTSTRARARTSVYKRRPKFDDAGKNPSGIKRKEVEKVACKINDKRCKVA